MTKDFDAAKAGVPFEEGLGFSRRTVEQNRRYETLPEGDKLQFLTEMRRGVERGLSEDEAWEAAWKAIAGEETAGRPG